MLCAAGARPPAYLRHHQTDEAVTVVLEETWQPRGLQPGKCRLRALVEQLERLVAVHRVALHLARHRPMCVVQLNRLALP